MLGRRTAAVEGHAPRAGEVVLLDALLVDELLRGDVTDREQDRGGDRLREERPRREAGLVPGATSVVVCLRDLLTGFLLTISASLRVCVVL